MPGISREAPLEAKFVAQLGRGVEFPNDSKVHHQAARLVVLLDSFPIRPADGIDDNGLDNGESIVKLPRTTSLRKTFQSAVPLVVLAEAGLEETVVNVEEQNGIGHDDKNKLIVCLWVQGLQRNRATDGFT